MRRLRFFQVAALCAVMALTMPCAPPFVMAQIAPAAESEAPAPYRAVAAAPAETHGDPSFVAFRKQFLAVARGRVFAGLQRLVVTSGFFWERDFGGAFNPKRSPAENLAAAVGLERNNGAGWLWLDAVAQEAAADPMPSLPGIVCAPAQPKFDAFDFDRVVEATRSKPTDWAYARGGAADVHAQPRERSAIVDKLGAHLVRVLGYESGAGDSDPARTGWARVATPSGKTGYVAPGKLAAAFPAQLCYAKNTLAQWRITGFVGTTDR